MIDLQNLLEHIARESIERWSLDERSHADSNARADRARIVAALQTKKLTALTMIAERVKDASFRGVLEAIVRPFLRQLEARVGEIATRVDIAAAQRTHLLIALRLDFVWTGILIDAVSPDSAFDPNLTIRSDLEAVGRNLDAGQIAGDVATYLKLDGEMDRLRRRALELRAERDMAEMSDDWSAEECWARRLSLSRLQAELMVAGKRGSSQPPIELATRLSRRRDELADSAERILRRAPPNALAERWEAVVAALEGETHEIAAHLKDTAPTLALGVVKLALTDVDRAQACAASLTSGGATPLENRRIAQGNAAVARCGRRLRADLQDKQLSIRLEATFGHAGAAWLERVVLLLVLVMVAAIGYEAYLEARYDVSHTTREIFAWLELALCSIFLFEFFLKLGLAEDRRLYFKRHWFVDFLASVPFGFVVHVVEHVEFAAYGSFPQLLRILRLLRLPALVRYLQVMRPLLRLVRLAAFATKASDYLVRRNASVFNRDIVLFEPEIRDEVESDLQSKFRRASTNWRHRRDECFDRLTDNQKFAALAAEIEDLDARLSQPLPRITPQGRLATRTDRGIRVESLVRRLSEMTPEQVVDAGGQSFVESLQRYLRLFDVPGIRSLPGIRRLVALRDRSAPEAAALAANHAGHWVQRVIDSIYYVADLHGTISGPIFLDRLGATLVRATAGPAKRLLSLGLILLALYAVVHLLGFRGVFHRFFEKTRDGLAGPITVLGLVCAIPMLVGIWFRRIANQATEYCERIVEAQFAAQTKAVKALHADVDERFLVERVIGPEIELRGLDNRVSGERLVASSNRNPGSAMPKPRDSEELLFLRTVDMLYLDYLDGALFHRNDTKTTNQLLGNLALTNLRHASLEFAQREAKHLRALDLSRAGSLFGGPYLWFSYINRIITQYTAHLIVDYNANAVPTARLSSCPAEVRATFREWLAARLAVSGEVVQLPPVGMQVEGLASTRRKRGTNFQLLESVDFTAMDFLAESPTREAELVDRYGQQLVDALRKDRANLVRYAFRSFPLHLVPLSRRTINPLVFYEKNLAGGKVFSLPFVLTKRLCGLIWKAVLQTGDAVRQVLDPSLHRQRSTPADSYSVARRKINRMRKPVFMRTLWLRARFDVEYVGLPMPSMPLEVGRVPPIERDLDFIGANRRDRAAAEQLRRRQHERLRWIGRWMGEQKLDFGLLPDLLEREFPFLANRGAEVVRALVAACIVDFDDLFSLASSLEGLLRCARHAVLEGGGSANLPANLPPRVDIDRPQWHASPRGRRPGPELFELVGFAQFSSVERAEILAHFRRHRTAMQGWLDVALGTGSNDPWAVWRSRALAVVLRTELWSDQLIALRTVQSLALLDLHHYCELVWKLGGYEASEGRPFDAVLPFD